MAVVQNDVSRAAPTRSSLPTARAGNPLSGSTARLLRADAPSSLQAGPASRDFCWTLTEGAAGMVSQVTGLAQAVGWPFEHRQTVLNWPFRKMWPGIIPPWKGVLEDQSLLQAEAFPRLAISCGRQGAVASIALKRKLGDRIFTVHIQDPKVPGRLFDLIVVPQHDGLTGPNVVQSLGAVHHITPKRLAEAAERGPTAEMRSLGNHFVGVILGGPNRYYGYTDDDVRRLIGLLRRTVEDAGVKLAIVPSRRTPAQALERLQTEFGSGHFVWAGQGENPYLSVLARATHLIVTGDSVSMTSEAAATRKPLYVFHLTERRHARRFRKFHQSFENAGITRPFEGKLETWSYASPDRTGLIAQLITGHMREGTRGMEMSKDRNTQTPK